jgi:hypothetical protein
MPAGTREDTWELITIPREDFARSYFYYKAGEHVVFAGPTQKGKTTLAFVLLEYTATPECPAYVIVSKPRDPVTEREGKRLGYRFTDHWPVERKVSEAWDGKPSGYIIWPKFGDIDKDIPRATAVSRAVLADRYTQGVKGRKGIIVCDDTVVKSKIFGLDREMTTHIAMAGAMDVGSWFFVQKPTGAGNAALWSYGNSEHVFIANEPDKRNRIRYDEIGGVDSQQVASLVMKLKPYEFLYIKRSPVEGRQVMCIVGAK